MNTMRLAALTKLVLGCCIIPSSGDDGTAKRAQTNHQAVTVNLLFGTKVRDKAAPKVAEMTEVNPYQSGQAQSVQVLRTRAIEALKQVGRPFASECDCVANIELSTGTCAVLLRKGPAPHYEVLFNSAGEITSLGGVSHPTRRGPGA